jgi:hypothetical protein
MQATKATEQRQDSRPHNTRLDDRYGKIGISAVAGALRHQRKQRVAQETNRAPHEHD